DVKITLAFLLLLLLVDQHFDLAAELRDVGLQLLDLAEKLDQSLALELRFERGDAVFELPLDLRHALVGRFDTLARLVVVEQRGARRKREAQSDQRERRKTRPAAGQRRRS